MREHVECPTCHGQGAVADAAGKTEDCPTCDGHGSIEGEQATRDVAEWSSGSRLELREEVGGLRYYLAGRPIHAGAGLEILLAEGVWVRGRYEWNYEREYRPLLYLELGGAWECDAEASPQEVAIRIPVEATLRWPRTSPFGQPPT